jgi:hypothetical protein
MGHGWSFGPKQDIINSILKSMVQKNSASLQSVFCWCHICGAIDRIKVPEALNSEKQKGVQILAADWRLLQESKCFLERKKKCFLLVLQMQGLLNLKCSSPAVA